MFADLGRDDRGRIRVQPEGAEVLQRDAVRQLRIARLQHLQVFGLDHQTSKPSPRESYAPLIACLEEVKATHHGGTSDQRAKAQKADEISNLIYSVKFALSLAMVCDFYSVYSQIAILLQVREIIKMLK